MNIATVWIEVEIKFNAGKFDPEEELQIGREDPKTNQFVDFTTGFSSEPASYTRQSTRKVSEDDWTSEEKLLHAIFGNEPFDTHETWMIKNVVEFDPQLIDIQTANLKVVAFDQESGKVIQNPEQVNIRETSMRIEE